ncbi:MAG: GGDEF domain-containing protein, partial [Acidobacteriota bacterium]
WWQQLWGKVNRASPAVPAADAIPREITTSENPVVAEPEEATRGDRGPEHGAGREAPSPPRPEEEEVGFELMEGAAWEGAEGKVPPDADDAAEQATPPAPPPAIVTKVPKDAETDAGAEGHVKQAERASPPGEQQKPSLEIEAPMPRARGPVPVCGEEDFRLELKRELSRCRRVGRPLTLILVRIADLSEIVELLGKDSRVQMLCHIAEQAVGTLREVDLIGLLASDERVALTAFASDRHGASRIVSRMQRALVDHPFNVGEGIPGIVPALRFGMASFPDQAQNADELLARAGREAES